MYRYINQIAKYSFQCYCYYFSFISLGNEYLVSIMFSHYDQNNNGRLEAEELWQAAERDHLGQLSASCILADMLLFDDPDADGTLDINEFYTAFSKLYSKWTFPATQIPPFFYSYVHHPSSLQSMFTPSSRV